MSHTFTLGFVSGGKRARTLMDHLYTIRDRQYLHSDRSDGWPDSFFDVYASDPPDWVEDISDYLPSVTAIMNPGRENRERAADLCREHGDDPRLFDSLEGFLDDDGYDAVVVASPTDAHIDSVIPLLEADTDVLCEKPLANSLQAHDRIIATAEESNAILHVGFQRRVDPFYRRIKSLIDSGAIGRLGMLSHVDVRDPFQMPHGPGTEGFRFDQARSGGALLEKNSHDFDLFSWYANSDPVRVTAFGGQHTFDTNTDIIDQAVVNVQYDAGMIASLELCLYNGVGGTDVYEVSGRHTSEFRGSNGVVHLPPEPGVIEVIGRQSHERITTDGGVHGGDLYQIYRFMRCLAGEDEPPMSAVDAKRAAAVAIAAERSLRNDGATVEIDVNYDLVD